MSYDVPIVPSHIVAVRGLQAKLREGIRQAWIDGKDFAHGQFQLGGDDAFSTKSLFDKWSFTVTCEAGPIDRQFDPDGKLVEFADMSYYRRPDFSESELRRFADGRHDWRDHEWQDHCGMPGCGFCEGGKVAAKLCENPANPIFKQAARSYHHPP